MPGHHEDVVGGEVRVVRTVSDERRRCGSIGIHHGETGPPRAQQHRGGLPPSRQPYRDRIMTFLERRYLRGESSTKSEGSQEMQVLGHDAGGYPLWVFSSSGLAFQLPRGEWNEATRTMEWKNAPTDQLLYTTRCTFETATTLRCSAQVKNLAGKVAIDTESVALRRRP